jgi:prepilin-type N-terminal cleavage/methylation domain-containing protein
MRRGGAGGFTLIEVVLTIVIVAVGLLGVIGALSFSTGKSINAEVHTTATALAQERMEQLIAEKRANGYGSAVLAVTPAPGWVAVPGFAGYERQTEICNAVAAAGSITKTAPCTAAGTANYKYITVTVRYTGLDYVVTSDVVMVITNT